MSSRLSVCVIGAGAAGLCAARHMAAHPSLFTFQVFEQTTDVGGTWVYTENTGIDENGLPVHSSMYENLRTNILQEIMGFPDFRFPQAEETSYPKHDIVLKYLRDYAVHFDLYKYVHFRTTVKRVEPVSGARSPCWKVTAYSYEKKTDETNVFDAVVVCNGHYSTPLTPYIPGIEEYEGEVLHSHDFRHSEPYSGRTVAILGAAASGRDIALELSCHATLVFLCSRGAPLASELPDNVRQVASIISATSGSFILEDGSIIEADTLIYCTGYMYSFPFLSCECGIHVRGRRVRPLYKQIINIENPTMGFIGIPFIVLPFPLFHYQVAFFLKTLLEPTTLPSKEEMYEDEKKEYLERLGMGFPPRYAHKMAELQWKYNDELADAAGIDRLPAFYKELYEVNSYQMVNFLTVYKKKCYTDIVYKDKLGK